MNMKPLSPMGQGAQEVHPTDLDHFNAWIDDTRRKLAVVRVKRKQPQTRADHVTLAEREARYSWYLERAGVLS